MANPKSKKSWESVDTVIRPKDGPPPIPAQAQPKMVAFSGGLIPQTVPGSNVVPLYSPPSVKVHSAVGHESEPSGFELPTLATKGKVLVVFGCRGGAGATMLSVNMAASLARGGKNVCLLDLDLQLGDVFVAMDMEANTSISAIAREAGAGKIDGSQLRRRLQRHDSGVYVLSQTGRLDDVDPELPERMPALLQLLTENFDFVVIDGIRDFGDHALAAMDLADRIALVLTQDVQAIRRASRVMQLMRRLGYSDRKIQVVVNRQSSKAPVAENEIERVLGMPITSTVRNDYAKLRSALDDGALLHDVARGAGVTRDVERTTKAVFEETKAREVVETKVGFFARFFGRGDK